MTNLEQKIDLIMQYIAAEDPNEQHRLRDEIRNVLPSAEPEVHVDISDDDRMRDVIEDLFRELGAPCHLNGYDQTAYAIKLIISDSSYLCGISKRLYPDVAKHFDTTPTRVERNIRHLVESAWHRHDIEDAYRVFGNTIDLSKGKPTNSEFVATCARIVKRRMRDGK